MLQRIRFPYAELDLARAYHWQVLEDIKTRLCTLNEVSERFFTKAEAGSYFLSE